MPDLDKFEVNILESVENGGRESKGDLDERLKELQSIIKNQKKRAISIHISEDDYSRQETAQRVQRR